MTSDEWLPIVDWVKDRFPDSKWHAEQAVAYFDDVSGQDATDVWAGLLGMYEKGLKFAPNGSQMLAAAKQERRAAAEADRYRALPEPKGQPMQGGYAKARFGEDLSWHDMIVRIHRERPPCNNKQCELHYQKVGGTYGE